MVINNNNNKRQCLWCCPHDRGHCKSSPGSFDECRLSAGWLPTVRPSQPTWAVSPPINGCYHPHPPSPFVIITQPESWYSFYHPTEGGRLSQRRHCRKDAHPVPKLQPHRSGCGCSLTKKVNNKLKYLITATQWLKRYFWCLVTFFRCWITQYTDIMRHMA